MGKIRQVKLWTTVSTAALLSACGGGSSVTPVTPQAPPPPTIPSTPTVDPASFRTAEYNQNWALDAVKAANAYASGYTGEGVIIGMVDFNFQLNSNEVNYSAASRGRDSRWVEIYEAQIGDTATTTVHGHSVSVMAAGVKNDTGTHGLAFDAEVLAVDFFAGVGVTTSVRDGVTIYQSNPYRYAVENGAKVVNKSLGYDEGDIIQNPPTVSERYVNAVDAYVVLDGGLLVSSAGNNSDLEPSLSNLDTINILRDNDLLDNGPGAFIIVGAVDQNNEMASFSDLAGVGESQNYYMVAPGVDVVSYWDTEADGPGLYTLNGTSFSAPLVSAAAALIWQRWPSLTAREVRQILFDTATDLGAAGVDEIFGHGLLNVDNALTAQGDVKVASTSTASGFKVRGAMLTAPTAFGDMGSLFNPATGSSQLSSVTVFDRYGRDFQMDLTGGIRFKQAQAPLTDFLATQQDWQASSLQLGRSGMHLNYGVYRQGSAVADLQRRGLFGEKERFEAQQVNAVVDMILPLSGFAQPQNFSQGGLFSGKNKAAEQASLRIGYGQSLLTAMDPMQAITKGSGTDSGIQALDASYVDRLDQGLAFDTGSFALVNLGRDKGGNQWSLGVGYSREQADLGGQNLQGVGASVEDTALPVDLASTSVMMVGYSNDSLKIQGKRLKANLQLGYMDEQGSLLGTASRGALSLSDHTRTALVRGAGAVDLTDKLSLHLSGTFAKSQLSRRADSLFEGLDQITMTRFKAALVRRDLWLADDHLSFAVSQPLRVEVANATLSTGRGVNWDQGEDVIYQVSDLSLAPTGREKAFEASYSAQKYGFQARIAAAYRMDAGHRAGVTDRAVYMTLSKSF